MASTMAHRGMVAHRSAQSSSSTRSDGQARARCSRPADHRVGDEHGIEHRLLGGLDVAAKTSLSSSSHEQVDGRPTSGAPGIRLVVDTAQNMSPEPWPAMLPTRASPIPTRRATRLELAAVERDVGEHDADAAPGVAVAAVTSPPSSSSRHPADRAPGDAQPAPARRSWRAAARRPCRRPAITRVTTCRSRPCTPNVIIPVPAPTTPSATGPASAAAIAARASATDTLRARASSSHASLHSPTTGADDVVVADRRHGVEHGVDDGVEGAARPMASRSAGSVCR